jgi:hypothetical protein
MTQPLTDAERDRIMEAAWALHPSQRAEFESKVAAELARCRPRNAARHPAPGYRRLPAHLP